MRILFGQGTPLPLRAWLAAHHIETARQHGWSELLNGELLAAAEAAGCDLFITTDQNLRHQLDLSRFRIFRACCPNTANVSRRRSTFFVKGRDELVSSH